MSDVDLLAALQASIASHRERQRQRDAEPCPACQGDRLRPDFTDSGACHAPHPATRKD